MNCPTCHRDDSSVLDSRPGHGGGIRRRRECNHCRTRWTTVEVPVMEYTRLQAATAAAESFASTILARR